jgi:hypothetical protein
LTFWGIHKKRTIYATPSASQISLSANADGIDPSTRKELSV